MKLFNGLPIYRITINPEKKQEGMDAISLVDDPAVGDFFLKFSKEKQLIKFSADEEKHIITGIALSCNLPIYRIIDDEECYVVFDKECIEQLVLDYSKKNLFNSVNLQHDDEKFVDGIYMIESYFVNHERGIAPVEFPSIEDGSYVVSYKVTDDALWEKIKKSGELNGFSIQGLFDIEPLEKTVEVVEVEDDGLEDFFDDLLNSLFVQERDVRGYIDDRRIVNITTSDGRTFEGQIYSVGKTNGMRSAIIQNNENLTWENILLEDIERIEQTERELVAWERQAPTFKDILDNDDITTEKTISAPITTVQEALQNNRVMMLNYYDEENSDGRGSRQIIIAHYGFTKRGNEMFIAYQYYGSSHSDPAGRGIWRTFLTKRVVSLQEIPNMEPVYEAPIGFTDNPSPECGTIFETATFLY